MEQMYRSSLGAQEQALPTEVAQDSWVPPARKPFPSHPSPLCLLRAPVVIFGTLVVPTQGEL